MTKFIEVIKGALGIYPARDRNSAYDAWQDSLFSEEKVRNLVKVRVSYVMNINPYSPDLNDLLDSMVETVEQREAIRRIWYEESMKFIEKNNLLTFN